MRGTDDPDDGVERMEFGVGRARLEQRKRLRSEYLVFFGHENSRSAEINEPRFVLY